MSDIIGAGGVKVHGPKKGGNKNIRQHQAMAQGYELDETRAYKNDLVVTKKKTGGTYIPSWTTSSPKR